MPNRVWKIKCLDGTEQIDEKTFPYERFSSQEIITFLQCLASSHLEKDEVISSFLPKDDRWYTPHLEIHREGGRFMTHGGGHHYVASVEEKSL